MRIVRLFKPFIITTILMLGAGAAHAQFSISKVAPDKITAPIKKDTVRNISSSFENQYFSEAKYLAERRQIRKERNTVSLDVGLTLNQTIFDNWERGGQNTFSGRAFLLFKHLYTREKFSFDYSFDARYGMSNIEGESFKNEDVFIFHAGSNWKMSKNWSYGATVDFRSQFTKGYKSRTEHILVSDFMAPGILDIGGGFTYKHLKEALEINISPIAGRMTFVLNDSLSSVGAHGVPAGDKQLSTLGSSFRLNYVKEFWKKKFKYRTLLYTFTNYGDRTTVQFDNTLEYKLGKLFSISAFVATYYDQLAKTPYNRPLQFNYVFGFGLIYNFKNK